MDIVLKMLVGGLRKKKILLPFYFRKKKKEALSTHITHFYWYIIQLQELEIRR